MDLGSHPWLREPAKPQSRTLLAGSGPTSFLHQTGNLCLTMYVSYTYIVKFTFPEFLSLHFVELEADLTLS